MALGRLIDLKCNSLRYKMVYATAFIEQVASLPLTCSSTFLTTKVDAEHIPNAKVNCRKERYKC